MRVPQFYVRSNVHTTNLDSAINRLLVNESLIDVTLSCDGHRFQCHRLVLAAASPLFEELLIEHPKEHPIVIIPIGVKWHILKSLIDFMYRGQTFVDQAELKALIESAELLQVIGLYDPQTQFREYFGEESSVMNNLAGEIKDQRISEEESNQPNSEIDANQEKEDPEEMVENVNEEDESKNEEMARTTSNEKSSERMETIVDFIEIDDSQDTLNDADDCTASEEQQPEMTNEMTNEIANETNADEMYDDTSSSPNINTLPVDPNLNAKKENNTDETTVEDTKLMESDILQNVPNSKTSETEERTMPTIRVTPAIKLINLFKLNRPGQSEGNQSPSKVPWTYIHIPAPAGSNIQSPSVQVPLKNTTPLPWAAVDALPKLMPAVISKPVQDTDSASAAVPSFLKFNSSSMAISVKNLDRTKTQQKLNVLNMALETEAVPHPQPLEERELVGVQLDDGDVDDDDDDQEKNASEESISPVVKQELEVKTEPVDFDSGELYLNHTDFPNFYDILTKDRGNKGVEEEAEAENIICQPNVSYIYDGDDYGKDVEYVDDDEDGVCIDYDRLVAETYGNMQEIHQEHTHTKGKKRPIKKFKKSKMEENLTEEKKISTSMLSSYYSPTLLPESSGHQRLKDPPTLVPLSVMNAGLGPKHLYYHHNKINNDQKGDIDLSKSLSVYEPSLTSKESHLNEAESHTQHSVILRNPRCNQPRHYSNESLYAALMAVKYGDSIYRASRLHQVPRKTLRNWMKRWDIKSQYPMPKQLKDAAKKKKLSQVQSA